MKRLRRFLLWFVAGIALLFAVLILGVNLYVQSQGVHRRIQTELSQRLDTPLRLRQISLTPWSGLKLNGITIPQEPGRIGGNFLEAQSFQLRVEFWSLFRNRLVIRQVSLIKPEIVWAQNSAGKWRLPELAQEEKSPVAATRTPNQAPLASPPIVPPASSAQNASPNESPGGSVSTVFTPEVQRVTLKSGDFTFLDSAGRVIAKFLGLDFHSSFRTATELKGNTTVKKISLRDRFFLEDLESPLRYEPTELAFSNISAHCAGGMINGRYEMQPQAIDSPFTAQVKFHDLQVEQLVTNAGGPPRMIQGRVEGFLDAVGKTADSNALSGHGEIVLRNGKLQQYSLLVALGQILQIDELTQLQLEEARVKYHIDPGIVKVDELILRSPNIRLTASGTVTFNGKLRLNSQLALNDKIRRQLFSPIRENFHPVLEPSGYAAVDFRVSGTVDRPKTDLMDKLVGQDLRDLGGVISSLFSHPKKKKPQPFPTPSPMSSPNEVSPSSSPSATASPGAPIPEASATPSP